jgi:hypothetical protein
MRYISIGFVFALMLVLMIGNPCKADVDVGVSIGDDGIKSFYLAIGDHYKVPENEIIVVRKKNIPDDELPIVFFLARKAGVSPEVIIKLRLGGRSWWDITVHFGLNASIYYVPLKSDPGPPYGKAYGHFKNKKKNEWNTIVLTDIDIINFVNLRFISEHYGYSADEVIKMRAKGNSFVVINTEVKKNKGQAKKQTKFVAEDDDDSKGKNKDKGKKK